MIRLQVTVKTDDEVLQLRTKVSALEGQIEEMTVEHNRLEYLYRCEAIVNAELVDLCRTSGVAIRPSMMARPRGPSPPQGD